MKQGGLKPQTEGQIMNIMFDLIAHHCCIRHPNFDYYPRPNKSKKFKLLVKRGAVWKKKLLSKKKRI